MSHTNFDKQLWQLFITAKKNILDKNTSEIKVDGYELEDNGKNIAFQLQYEDPLIIAKTIIKRYFKDAEIKEDDGIIQFSVSKDENSEVIVKSLDAIKKQLEPLFFLVEVNPKQEILFKSPNSILGQILRLQEDSYLSDTLYLTKSEIFDVLLPNGYVIDGDIGAVFSVSISFESFKRKVLNQLSTISNEKIILDSWETLKIKNGYFTDAELEKINNSCTIEVKVSNIKALFSNSSEIFKEEFFPTEGLDDPTLKLHVYTKTRIKETKLLYFETFYEISLKDSFSNGIEKSEWNDITNTLEKMGYFVVPHKGIISFDFNKEVELEQKFNFINTIDNISLNGWGDKHRFKVKLKTNRDSFSQLKKQIKDKFKWVYFKDLLGGENAIVSLEYSVDEKGENKLRKFIDFAHEQAIVHNSQIQILDDTKYTFQIKYDKETAHYAAQQKLTLLKGADFKWQRNILGKLLKINNKKLIVRLDENLTQEFKDALASKVDKIESIKPELQGEVDKLFRLQEVVQTIDDPKKTIVNPKLRDFFFDSSKATPIDESFFDPNHEKWLDIVDNAQSKTLSSSQKRAVASALYSTDIAMIQGPPGTGKSTVIAEIIWQHLYRNPKQRVLLTSETNMAVDNAIERVVKNYNIVKPIRFGDDAKLENEGARFSLNRIKKWVGIIENDSDEESDLPFDEAAENIEDNVLKIWFDNINKRSQNQSVNNENESALNWWHEYLQSYPQILKELFLNKYVANANLFGATSSSISWKNGRKGKTPFFWQWLEIYPDDEHKVENPIKFDVTIIDEASKATPPELALPLLFSKKGIIVGDHRQLPPMLDDEEFEATLELNGEKELLKEFKKYDTSKSHFEKLFLNPELSSTLKTTFDTQFRMHPAIGSVIQQFYTEDLGESGLHCGLDPTKVEEGFDEPQSRYHGLTLDGFIKPHQHCIWVNVETAEIKEGTSRVNYGEVEAVKWVLDSIKASDGYSDYINYFGERTKKPEDSEIGIISFYSKQLQALYLNIEDKTNLRISTVDRFQGMERNIVIVSLVRSNIIATNKLQEPNFELFEKGYQEQPDLGFAKSPNRLNVALSRAKRLLIIVGNAKHFAQKEMYAKVIEQIKNSDNGSFLNFIP